MGWGFSGVPIPSTVVTSRPSTVGASTRHEFTGSPSSSTVQAPQFPCSQPNFGPVTCRCSRSRLSRFVVTGASTCTRFPFNLKVIVVLAMVLLRLLWQAASLAQAAGYQHAGELAAIPGRPVNVVDRLGLGHGPRRRVEDGQGERLPSPDLGVSRPLALAGGLDQDLEEQLIRPAHSLPRAEEEARQRHGPPSPAAP